MALHLAEDIARERFAQDLGRRAEDVRDARFGCNDGLPGEVLGEVALDGFELGYFRHPGSLHQGDTEGTEQRFGWDERAASCRSRF